MSDNTSIEWADTTWSPILGCDRVSPGCDNCYAITQAHIRAANPHPRVAAAFAGLTERTDHGIDWTGRINQLPDRLTQPFSWRKPRKVFVNSLADLFHDGVIDDYIVRVFAVMAATPQHTYQILTKRHGRMRSLLNSADFVESLQDAVDVLVGDERDFIPSWPLPNVWLGVSVEDQKRADLRIPALLATPAAVRWVSAEPLLGPLDLARYLTGDCPSCGDDITEDACCLVHADMAADNSAAGLSWVVTGGESGPGARPAHPDWFRVLRDQCQDAGVAYLHKQHGAYTWQIDSSYREPNLYVNAVTGEALREDQVPDTGSWKGVWRVGKKAAGRELDGQTWDQYPETSTAVAR